MALLSPAEADLFLLEHHLGVLTTLKADGRPQLSNVAYALRDGRVAISVTADRAKTANALRDPRVSLHVTSEDFWTYLVVEGEAELSPVSTTPGDATGLALLATYEAIRGEAHPDPEEFLAAMVAERRRVLSFAPGHRYPLAA